MGINLGAAMSPLLCGYIGETYGWHYGFGLATIGMLIGVAVFVAPIRLTQVLIMAGAVAAAGSLFYFHPGQCFSSRPTSSPVCCCWPPGWSPGSPWIEVVFRPMRGHRRIRRRLRRPVLWAF